ncbi:MAG TPA: pyridoxamine 5'-phosphate oxidase family protein [Streptosporangiaceae bacterium]|nr:pyridoxamine 5'-phosphate oxidase family protein [Streptosporangiaceae bacterium]
MSATQHAGRTARAGRAGQPGQVPGAGFAGPGPYGPGDLARRISSRRAELKLTRPQLAARAGLREPYLRYLEESTARPTPAALRQLAAALQTTPAALLGAGLDRPPGAGGQAAARQPELKALTPEACYGLLAPGGIGRVAFSTKAGPVVLPVNFVMAGHTIVFRTGPATALSAHAYDDVAFEVDHFDEALHQGWSVLLSGTAHRVTDQGELARLRRQAAVEPWPGGSRDVYVRIIPARISGRRIRAG